MTTGSAGWIILFVAIVLANLPWLSPRILFIFPSGGDTKHWLVRLLEWLAMFFLTGFLALGLERKMTGAVYEQGWEFYVVGLCLFAVFAIPGLIWHVDLGRRFARRRADLRRQNSPN